MKILITGGLGYIGSHVTSLLLQKGIEVIVLDNLDNTRLEVLDGIESITGTRPIFKQMDVCDEHNLKAVFDEFHDIGGGNPFCST